MIPFLSILFSLGAIFYYLRLAFVVKHPELPVRLSLKFAGCYALLLGAGLIVVTVKQ